MQIRHATPEDWPGIWPTWHRIVAEGTTYVWDPSTDEETARAIWMNEPPGQTFVANASYMVDPIHGRRGMGRMLCGTPCTPRGARASARCSSTRS